MRRWLTGWRVSLRLARRDLARHRGRAIIALVMVTLPVLAVVGADVLMQTAKVSATEGMDRRLGTVATARVEILDTLTGVVQAPDPLNGLGSGEPLSRPTSVGDIEGVIGHRTMLPMPTQTTEVVRTPHGKETMVGTQLDASAPLARGLFRLESGRWPATPDEVVVNKAARDRGVGNTLTAVQADGTETTREVVGTVADATVRSAAIVVGLPGSLPVLDDAGPSQAWLVDGPPISWSQLERLNALGVTVTDRQIATHPGDYPDPLQYSSSDSGTTMQVVALIVVMALIEVVLLAGPAFAVGARKQQRSIALLVASGGTPAQARRVILAGGVVLGAIAAVVGVVGGIGAAWLLQPLVQRFSGDWLGPFDVPWPHLLAVAAFGLLSALTACVVPAWIASRQDVVAVLAGRRGDPKPGRAFPVLGVVLFAVGILMAFLGAGGHGELTVAWSAVVCVLGMVLLVPVVVSWVALVAGRFPLAIRFAARDAVRHRTRTTPAVAAVAATVAGVVALGIGTSSDERENRETYQPSLVMGDASVTPSYSYVSVDDGPTDWSQVEDVVRDRVPGARITEVAGVAQPVSGDSWTDVQFRDPAAATAAVDEGQGEISPGTWGSTLGSDVLVSDGGRLPPLVTAADPGGDVARALRSGRAVVFSSDRSKAALERVTVEVQPTDDEGQPVDPHSVDVPATVLYRAEDAATPVRAILPPALAQRAGIDAAVVGLDVEQPHLSKTAQKDLDAALQDLATPATVYVERGYEADPMARIVQWVLAALGAILMLGGTLTASFLALSDARPDLATLQAVGAAPRTRRAVAAAYTFVVGFVGAVLGMLVGFVPGLAITWPLTAESYADGRGPYLEVPWLMIAVVVLGLPVLTALVVGLFTRSRLPMATRIG
ncbi:putative ABC transport system permease protein [Nocardioides terrae]|uniref:Putative ABC transport system permease protein n=1 Tax=Nocardioides terrae TaxID=574651 RepID=A0A1I1GPC5_9ACTN|nr:ABC transporter permease [Nocardioides terrae]SFC13619.1 putative ABC transport system permease protein [Nocardioides terrae]